MNNWFSRPQTLPDIEKSAKRDRRHQRQANTLKQFRHRFPVILDSWDLGHRRRSMMGAGSRSFLWKRRNLIQKTSFFKPKAHDSRDRVG